MAGTDGFWECEGVDQPDMKLPGRQAKHQKGEYGRVNGGTSSMASVRYFCIPWELKTFIFRGYNPYVLGV